MPVNDLGLDLAAAGRPVDGGRWWVGTVTDASVWPPLIDGVPVTVIGPYVPINGDRVMLQSDWNGSYSTQRVCLGRVMTAGGVVLRRAANQTAAAGATTVSWDTEDRDQGGWITVTGTTLTVPAGARAQYAITAVITGAGSWAAGSSVLLTAGGTAYRIPGVSTSANLAVAATTQLNAADTITVAVSNAGSSQNMTARIEVIPVD